MKEETSYGGFGCVISAQPAERNWVPAGFPVASGFWTFREPDAVVIVQNDRLRVAAVPFTRSNDEMQFLDNAKHMYFSTRTFEAPKNGRLTVEWDMAAQIVNGHDGDLYDGFVSFHLMDLAAGVAIDVFAGNHTIATVYARLPFPGASAPRAEAGPRFFSLFDEFQGVTEPGQLHRYAIVYDRGEATLEWHMDGKLLKREVSAPDLGPSLLALGMMTEKDIVPKKGSVSCHGQGAVATWGGIRVISEAR
ncbi:MAG TPA: DUF6081 family protein [Myxococcota bacterium]|nr:DUF6081 family protein [Myxococcota bacterium]